MNNFRWYRPTWLFETGLWELVGYLQQEDFYHCVFPWKKEKTKHGTVVKLSIISCQVLQSTLKHKALWWSQIEDRNPSDGAEDEMNEKIWNHQHRPPSLIKTHIKTCRLLCAHVAPQSNSQCFGVSGVTSWYLDNGPLCQDFQFLFVWMQIHSRAKDTLNHC